jgi:hypothetical protein
MLCPKCGKEMGPESQACSACDAPAPAPASPPRTPPRSGPLDLTEALSQVGIPGQTRRVDRSLAAGLTCLCVAARRQVRGEADDAVQAERATPDPAAVLRRQEALVRIRVSGFQPQGGDLTVGPEWRDSGASPGPPVRAT